MSTDITTVVITEEQKELIKLTVAKGATDAELQLFIYDCKRRNVHPLDRLIHFTKRKNNKTGDSVYTPITSIDFLRTRAAGTGEYAGNDDATFVESDSYPASATVVVHRFVQGQRIPFSATARWVEYYPGDGGDGFMWRKMPHVLLSKCAEALALRKAFPLELGGIYSAEELALTESVENGSNVASQGPKLVKIKSVQAPTKAKGPHLIYTTDGQKYSTFSESLVEQARQVAASGANVILQWGENSYGKTLQGIRIPEQERAVLPAGSPSPTHDPVPAQGAHEPETTTDTGALVKLFGQTLKVYPSALEKYIGKRREDWADEDRAKLKRVAEQIALGTPATEFFEV